MQRDDVLVYDCAEVAHMTPLQVQAATAWCRRAAFDTPPELGRPAMQPDDEAKDQAGCPVRPAVPESTQQPLTRSEVNELIEARLQQFRSELLREWRLLR